MKDGIVQGTVTRIDLIRFWSKSGNHPFATFLSRHRVNAIVTK